MLSLRGYSNKLKVETFTLSWFIVNPSHGTPIVGGTNFVAVVAIVAIVALVAIVTDRKEGGMRSKKTSYC